MIIYNIILFVEWFKSEKLILENKTILRGGIVFV